MIKKFIGLCIIFVIAFLLQGCGKSHTVTNPEIKKEIKQVEPIVRKCVTTSKSKKALISCLAPKGHEKELEECAIKAARHDLIHHVRLVGDVSACVVKFR